MKDKHTEKILQSAADSVKPKSFDERYASLKDSLPEKTVAADCACALKVTLSGTAAATVRLRKILIASAICLIIALAIALPVVLSAVNGGGYTLDVSADEFYDALRSEGINVPDMQGDDNSYKLSYDGENNLVGGEIQSGESQASVPADRFRLSFPDKPYDDERFYGEGGGVYDAPGADVRYYAWTEGEKYSAIAAATFAGRNYVIEWYGYSGGFDAFFDFLESQFYAAE